MWFKYLSSGEGRHQHTVHLKCIQNVSIKLTCVKKWDIIYRTYTTFSTENHHIISSSATGNNILTIYVLL